MEEREIWCCGARGWSLVIAWVQIIWGILALLALGKQSLSVLGVIKPDKDLQDELEIPPTAVLVLLGIYAVLAILAVLSIIMAIVLIRGCKNKNSKQLTIWILYAKILLVIVVVFLIVRLFFIPLEQVPRKILSLCIQAAVQVFCIRVVGLHKKEIEASSGSVVSYKV